MCCLCCWPPPAAGPRPSPEPGTSDAASLNIVAAFYPFQFIAERVAGDHAIVTSLTGPGAEPHDLELTPSQVASLAEADLVVYEKSFQAAVDEAVAQSGNPNVLDTATVVPLQPSAADAHEPAAPRVMTGSRPARLARSRPTWSRSPTRYATARPPIDPGHAADYTRNAREP